MAPTLTPTHHTALPTTMTSQTNLPSILKSSPSIAARKPFKFGTTTSILVGKDNTALEVMCMAPASGEQFMRSTCFDHLISTLQDNRNCFTPSELTAAINSTLPISTTTAADTAHQICTPILHAPYKLLCALKNDNASENHTQAELDVANSLCAIVRYRTPFFYQDSDKPCIISFGLGENVTVNSILGLPQLKRWKSDVLFQSNTLVAHNIAQTFALEYAETLPGLPAGVTFSDKDFKDPTANKPVLTVYDQPSDKPRVIESVTDSTNNGCSRRSVELIITEDNA